MNEKDVKELAEYMRQRNQSRMKRINHAFSLPRIEKWKAVIKIFVEENPELETTIKEVKKSVKEQREDMGVFNKKAMSGDDMQLGLLMPAPFWTILETCDPEFKEIMSDDTKGREDNRAKQRQMMKLLKKAFPEYTVPMN